MNAEKTTLPKAAQPRPGWILISATTVFVILAALSGFGSTFASSGDISRAIGAGVAPFFWSVIIVLLFSIRPHYRSPLFRTKILLWTSVLITIVQVQNFAASNRKRLESGIELVAAKINGSAPMMIDSATRLERATAGPGALLTIRETFVEIDARNVDLKDWATRVVPELRKSTLQNPAFSSLISRGVRITIRYYGRDSVFIGEIAFNADDVRGN